MKLNHLFEAGVPPGQVKLCANVLNSAISYFEAGDTEKAMRLLKEVQKNLSELAEGK